MVPRQPRLRDVAQAAGVSVSLVSSFLNTPELVAEKSSVKIAKAVEELGFVPNQAARQLRSGKSKMLALVAFDVGDPFFAAVARGARRRASAAGLSLVLADTDGDRDAERQYLSLFEEHRVRGLILAPVDEEDAQLDRLAARGIPGVLLDQDASSARWSSVSVDNAAGGEIAVRHLLDQGSRRIAVIGGTLDIPQVVLRRKGAARAVRRHDDSALIVVDTETRDAAAGRESVARLLASETRFDGLFCINDSVASGALQALEDSGLRVPADVAVVGYNDMAADVGGIPHLSSVRHPHEEFGAAAVELVLERLGDVDVPPRQIRFSPELITRRSSQRI
ncbi:LacI family DNA-binding transcriptional regulator [Rathayibacter festucae]|uniref:LacI family DNA-binding transcriptional regulator n=1 Tax=Rathayibacter festucae TaxID=110937 RepID=UPI002A6AAC10|nr:LacI family DNA-binding transcriptional regulator [Rathayibacter festucae]MDY0914531.1 LacI family DNA-binding transcriptional regulator [Rathayibacter festucae]